jgi:aminopeptidase S
MTRLAIAGAVGVLLGACAATAGPSLPAPTRPPMASATVAPSTSSPSNPAPVPTAMPSPLTSEGLRTAVEVTDIRAHLEELQRVADANGGNRATGTAGFDASVEYVAGKLAEAGYDVERQPFLVGDVESASVLVERAGATNEVILIGAHLDSVRGGPGMNDNGSGVATLLALAERLAESPDPDRTVRLGFWGAEEGGPFGSQAYVDALAPDQRQGIIAYLNLDMLGSTNFIRFVYDEPSAAEGSEAITALFATYFEDAGMAWEPIDLSGHSDHGAFAMAGIPTGGLFSGGRELKTDAQAAAFGGTAGAPSDACSDAVCDSIGNVNVLILDEMADAVAHAVATLAATP